MKAPPPVLDAVNTGGDAETWRRCVEERKAAYRAEARLGERRRTHLQSAKILNAAGGFVCEAIVQDMSADGLRLLLAKNCGLPPRFGVHLDLTSEVLTATLAWRRERLVGAKVVAHAPPSAMKASDLSALAGRYYGIKG